MTTYKTGNPLGSTSPKDLFDNSENLDKAANDLSSEQWVDRFGRTRTTLHGIEASAGRQRLNIQDSANLVLAGLGYAVPVEYVAGLSMTLQTQTVSFGGVVYAPKADKLPFTTSGAFETDRFRVIQGVSGQDLASDIGASMVGMEDGFMLDDLQSVTAPTKAHRYGGQLRRLASALVNPFHQEVNIAFIGDSITWGRWVPDNSPYDPRNQSLQDPRDNSGTASYVNRFKRYIGAEFFNGEEPTLSNWPASPSGQSTTLFSREIDLYVLGGGIQVNLSGGAVAVDREAISAFLGRQYYASIPSSGGEFSISFKLTGSEFTLAYTQISSGADYELIVGGVSQGTYSTSGESKFNTQRKHSFSYIYDGNVVIKVANTQSPKTAFYVEGLIIQKKCRITNQGINGASFVSYAARCFGAFGPSVTSQNDEFYFVQLGTNDRVTGGNPKVVSTLHNSAVTLLGLLPSSSAVILMAANPAVQDHPAPGYGYSMNSVRNTINNLAREKSIDFIDNYSVFRGGDLDFLTADGLHPNARGHFLIARNIVAALESA